MNTVYLCQYFTIRTHVTLLGLNNLEFHVKFGSSNTHCILQAARMSPSTQPPLKWNLHCIKKAYNCYVRHNSACSFSLFCYSYVKVLVLKALSFSVSKNFYFVFQLVFWTSHSCANSIFLVVP